jgi:hypothetical protein
MEIAPEQQRAQELIASRLVVLKKVSGRFYAVPDMRAEISAAVAKARTVVPASVETSSSLPPNCRIRSLMPRSPTPRVPMPSSPAVSSTLEGIPYPWSLSKSMAHWMLNPPRSLSSPAYTNVVRKTRAPVSQTVVIYLARRPVHTRNGTRILRDSEGRIWLHAKPQKSQNVTWDELLNAETAKRPNQSHRSA